MTRPGEDLHELDVLLPDGVDPESSAEAVLPPRVPAELRLPYDVDEADAYDQTQVVELDDEY